MGRVSGVGGLEGLALGCWRESGRAFRAAAGRLVRANDRNLPAPVAASMGEVRTAVVVEAWRAGGHLGGRRSTTSRTGGRGRRRHAATTADAGEVVVGRRLWERRAEVWVRRAAKK